MSDQEMLGLGGQEKLKDRSPDRDPLDDCITAALVFGFATSSPTARIAQEVASAVRGFLARQAMHESLTGPINAVLLAYGLKNDYLTEALADAVLALLRREMGGT